MTLASFQTPGSLPEDKLWLKISERGRDRGSASSLRIRLLIASGLAALPNCKTFKVDLTSSDVRYRMKLLYGELRFPLL